MKQIINPVIGFSEKDKKLHGADVMGYRILGGDDLLFDHFKHCSVVNNVTGSML